MAFQLDSSARQLEVKLPLYCRIFIALFFFFSLTEDALFHSLEWNGLNNSYYDLQFAMRRDLEHESPPEPDIIHVDVDNLSTRELKTVVLDRKRHMAVMLEGLRKLGARHVILDIEYFDPAEERVSLEKVTKLTARLNELKASIKKKYSDDFQRQFEIGQRIQQIQKELQQISEDPNQDFADQLSAVTATVAMHWQKSEDGKDHINKREDIQAAATFVSQHNSLPVPPFLNDF